MKHMNEDDKEINEFVRWYELARYLERDERGFIAVPWVLKSDAPEWCPDMLERWKRRKAKGFKVP